MVDLFISLAVFVVLVLVFLAGRAYEAHLWRLAAEDGNDVESMGTFYRVTDSAGMR